MFVNMLGAFLIKLLCLHVLHFLFTPGGSACFRGISPREIPKTRFVACSLDIALFVHGCRITARI
jgi:hypothetical protein